MIMQSAQSETIAEQLLNDLMEAALKERASDIHIDPRGEEIIVRFRVDGILKEMTRFEFTFLEPLNSRLKVLAQLDITNHTQPQEGHFEWFSTPADSTPQQQPAATPDKQRVLDVRISTFPTIYGESVVMRILNRTEVLIPLAQLGFNAHDRSLIEQLMKMPYGMVLTTGPAGSGKTTLLYAMLQMLILPEKNIITLEDPVEYHLKNVRQSQVHPERGFTFEMGMRSILRQDPDIIMIGEIRDPATVEAAINASLTGRLVFSSLHANSSVGTIARLIDMKIDPALIAYSMNGVIAQRLVRRVCQSCKAPYQPDPKSLTLFGLSPDSGEFMKGEGCNACNGLGYQGRVGIFEVLTLDNDLRRAIVTREPIEKIDQLAHEKGLHTLREDGVEKIKAGVTTVEELLRISI